MEIHSHILTRLWKRAGEDWKQLWEQEALLERDRRMDRQSSVLHLGPGGWPVPSLMYSNPMPQRARVWVIPESSGWYSLGTAKNPEGVLCQLWGAMLIVGCTLCTKVRGLTGDRTVSLPRFPPLLNRSYLRGQALGWLVSNWQTFWEGIPPHPAACPA